MSAEIAKLGNVELSTPNLSKSVAFFRDVIGLEEVEREGSTVYMRAWGDFEHHTLRLSEGEGSAMTSAGWQVKHPEDLDAFESRIKASGTEVMRSRPNTRRGVGEIVSFELPSGHTFELYYDVERPKPPADKRSRLKNQPFKSYQKGVSPRRIDHLNINVPDAPQVHTWLTDNLGFKMREYIRLDNGYVPAGWMSATPLVHDIAVMTDTAGRPRRMHHFAYFCDSPADILRAADIVLEAGADIDVGPGRHGISQAMFLYVKDPGSGHRIELFAGGYLIFDPAWEAVEWSEAELADGIIWWGPELPSTFLDDSSGPTA